MKIVADKNIPFLEYYFSGLGELIMLPAESIRHEVLRDADVLLIRSVTKVNQALLQNTKIKFVGTATTGFDHIDTAWLEKNNIQWSAAQGCNADAVVEYVVAVIAALQQDKKLANKKLRAAVIGVGTIGNRVVKTLELLGFEVIQCDPLRALQEKDFPHTPLEELTNLDFITLHTPLTRTGKFPTYHFINADFLQRQQSHCILLNSSRGAVIDFADLKHSPLAYALDVWDGEPMIDKTILNNALIATPHIAGYTQQAKYRGVEMIYHATVKKNIIPDRNISPLPFPTQTFSLPNKNMTWQEIVLQIYDPRKTTQVMKNLTLETPKDFYGFRESFQDRCEFTYTKVVGANFSADDKKILKQLGILG